MIEKCANAKGLVQNAYIVEILCDFASILAVRSGLSLNKGKTCRFCNDMYRYDIFTNEIQKW